MARKNGIFGVAVVAGMVCMSAVLHADERQSTLTYSIGIQGMTCETCSAHARKELTAVPGVVKASVDDKAGHAWVTVEEPLQPVGASQPRRIGAELAAAVERTGYRPTVNYVLIVKGMTCEACSRHIQDAVVTVPGVAAASVNYKGGYAVVVPREGADNLSKGLVAAMEQAGYGATVLSGP